MSGIRNILAATLAFSIALTLVSPAQSANAVTFTKASAATITSVKDAWSRDAPRTARAKLSWAKPKDLFGAKLVSYKIEKSFNNKKWVTAIASTGLVNSAEVTSGLKIGVANYFRVKAITQKGSTKKVGVASNVISKKLTTAPASPVLLGTTSVKIAEVSDSINGLWLPQSNFARGGLEVTYKFEASAKGYEDITCVTSSQSCELRGLEPGIVYSTRVKAINKKAEAFNREVYTPDDPEFFIQWYLNSELGVGADRAWTVTRGSSSVLVAVLDSGITSHPEIDSQIVAGFDFVSNKDKSGDGDGIDANPSDEGDGVLDANGDPDPRSSWHGTHVAGIIAAKSDDVGITGIAPNVKVQPIRVLGTQGQGSASDLAIAILWAAGYAPTEIQNLVSASPYRVATDLSKVPTNKTPARVINMSMAGLGNCPGVVQMAIDMAEKKNVLLVSAAGNGDADNNPQPNKNYYPTNCAGPISVGATGASGDAAYYSNYGVDISAPGGDDTDQGGAPNESEGMIYSISNDGEVEQGDPAFALGQGTSMAAPIVSGILALLISAKPTAKSAQIWTALRDSATPFETGTSCSVGSVCGVGIANAANALKRLFEITS